MNITKNEIEQVVKNIMIIDGPDGHIDGSNVITSFIISLLSGNHEQWLIRYEYKNQQALQEKLGTKTIINK